jgi:hypothetical protein
MDFSRELPLFGSDTLSWPLVASHQPSILFGMAHLNHFQSANLSLFTTGLGLADQLMVLEPFADHQLPLPASLSAR